MQKLLISLRVAVGLFLLLGIGGLGALFLSVAISDQATSIKDRLVGIFCFSFFTLLGIAIWRILLFRRECPVASSPLHAMSLFKTSPGKLPDSLGPCVPVTVFDVTLRYDIYCSILGEERLYENVKLTGIRTFERTSQFLSVSIGCFLEIESANNTRTLIPQFGIQMICEHGIQPSYKVIRPRPMPPDGDSRRKDS